VNTPSILIDLCAGAGREIDRRFPGLREQDHYAWLRKVVWLLKTTGEAQNNPYHFGLKSAHGPNQAISGDTIGILSPGSIAETGRRDFYAVSIIRHNPPTNEWRIPLPLDYGMVSGQWWIEPTQEDLGENPPVPEEPPVPEQPKPDEPGPIATTPGVQALLEQVLVNQDELVKLGRQQTEHLTAIRGDIANFTKDVKEQLPKIIAVLGGGALGGLLGRD
jgi:hypothetical protein